MTADGRWVSATHTGYDNFNAALLLKKGLLKPGTYFVCVDPAWDPSANYHADYKKVMVDVYSTLRDVNLQLVSEQQGNQLLTQTLKYVAMNMVPKEKRDYHHESDEDYGRDVFKVVDLDSTKCWYGFIYLRNDSGYQL